MKKMTKVIFFTIYIILVMIASTLFTLKIISSAAWMLSIFCLVIVAIIFTNRTKKRT